MNIFRNFAFIVGLLGATTVSAADAAVSDVFMEPGGPLATRLLYPASYRTCQIIGQQITTTWKMLLSTSPNLFADIGKAISGYLYETVYDAPEECGEAIFRTTGKTYGEALSLRCDFERKTQLSGRIADPLTFLLECEDLRLEHKFMAAVAGLSFDLPTPDDISAEEYKRRFDFLKRHFAREDRLFMVKLQDELPQSIQRAKEFLVYSVLTKVSASLIYNTFMYNQAPQKYSPARQLPDDPLRNVLEFAYGPLKYSLDSTLFLRARLRCSIPTYIKFSKDWWDENTREARYQLEKGAYVAAGNPSTSFHQAFVAKYR